MDFELLDGYLLAGRPPKEELVSRLLAARAGGAAAAPFYEGVQRLGARTPHLALIALRLVLAGKKADDEAVTRLRGLIARARGGDADAADEYRDLLRPPTA